MLTNTAWADGQKELDIVIAALRLTLGAKEARAETYPLAVVSQNAAARRFRRALKGACRHHGRPRRTGADQPSRFANSKLRRHNPERGERRGSVMRFTDMEKKENLVFAARTFV